MATEVKSGIELEIAHVLFIDTVGYSKLLINEQRQLLDELNRVVRSTNRFRAAESAGKLTRLPTGDGMILVFSDSPEAPAECALEIGRALKQSANLPLRMGIHSGPVSRVVDVNDRSNAAGAGINIAERVMSCGDAGHILLSKRTADDLIEYPHWRPYLHEIGECAVKHGAKIGLVNLYGEDAGNPQLPSRCQEYARTTAIADKAARAKIPIVLATIFASGLVVLLTVFFAHHRQVSESRAAQKAAALPAPSYKSIAVLPFDNLSDDKQNAYFAGGVQDEILADLAKVSDLKVISRTSVMAYKNSANRNLREIAQALGVAHILEGTVQREAGRVRVSAQLIDARTDTHVWGETYNRDLADVFAIESELAEKIVAQLKTKLSPEEKAAIEERPTADLAAYDLYAHAKALIADAVFNEGRNKENLEEAVRLLTLAIERDPGFLLAYYQLAHAHDQLYFIDADHTPARLALAETAIRAVQRLRPNSGEAHLALAKHLYWGSLDWDRARQEVIAAQRTLPNDPFPFLLAGYIDRRQGHWQESMRNLERALELDPRNLLILQQISLSYENLRSYGEAAATLERALLLAPKDVATRMRRAKLDLEWHADTKPLHSMIQAIIAENPKVAESIAGGWMDLALCERDVDGAARALSAMTPEGYLPFPRAWCEGLVARTRGDALAERTAFSAARVEIEKTVHDQPDYAKALGVLGMIDAALGRKEDAIREGRRAVELLPITKDSIDGALLAQYLAAIYAWSDQKDLALEQLSSLTKLPGYLSYGQLRLHPYWDPLRSDPRFDEIVASLAPAAAKP